MSVTRNTTYISVLGFAFSFATLPAMMTLAVDPYQIFAQKERTTAINDIAEKSHYPLWKLAKFERGTHDTIILGDSRARALRDKYWHELKIPGALNLAYGGGTIPEIYSTYTEIKSDPAIKNLIVGVQLRSFDENHKGGMNRVPEAVRLIRNKLEYLKNWDVFQTTFKLFKKENETTLKKLNRFGINAHASELGKEGNTSLSKLLEPEICFGCDLPVGLKSVKATARHETYSLPNHYRYRHHGWKKGFSNHDWHQYSALYEITYTIDKLPQKFDRQVSKNGKADWRSFEFSKKYWSYFEDIGAWAKSENKNLIFVIPPTISNMQQTIQAEGLGELNHQLRLKLSELGTVIDLDYPNKLTNNIKNFNDAYHFNAQTARQIVGQIIPLITNDKEAINKVHKRERHLKCASSPKTNPVQITPKIQLSNGKNCRIWRIKI